MKLLTGHRTGRPLLSTESALEADNNLFSTTNQCAYLHYAWYITDFELSGSEGLLVDHDKRPTCSHRFRELLLDVFNVSSQLTPWASFKTPAYEPSYGLGRV